MPLTDPNSHIMYQPTYAAYPASQSMGTWGQQPTQQAYAYTAYPQSDRAASYTDTTSYSTQSFQPIQYGTTENDFYRQPSGYTFSQQATSQWAPSYTTNYASATPSTQTYSTMNTAGSAGYSGSVVEPRSVDQSRANTFNPAATQLPNMSRPPPVIKRENGDNTFHASLSMLENPAQASAAYTASWVSNATTIPPDLKEEQELFSVLPTTDLSGAVFPQVFADQFGQLTLNTDPPKDADMKKKEGDRRPIRDQDGKVLTWDERIKKAHVQKERAEFRNDRPRNQERPDRERLGDKENNRNGPRAQYPPRPTLIGQPVQTRGISNGPRDIRDTRQQKPNGGGLWKNDNGELRDDMTHANRTGNRTQLHNPATMPLMRTPNIPLIFNPNYAIPGQAPMIIPRGMPFMAPPRHLMNNIQDERFKNTWLDAGAYTFPVPYGQYGPIAYPPVDARGFRGGPRGGNRGRGGYRGVSGGRNGDFIRRGGEKKDQERQGDDNTHESSPALTTASGQTENNISLATETPAPADTISPVAAQSGVVA